MFQAKILLVFMVSLALSSAELQCIESNCTEPDLKTLFASLDELVNLNNNKDDIEIFKDLAEPDLIEKHRFDDAIDPRIPVTESPSDEPAQGLLLIRIKQFVVFPNEDNVENSAGPISPNFQIFGDINKMFEEIGILDLSWKNLTGKSSF